MPLHTDADFSERKSPGFFGDTRLPVAELDNLPINLIFGSVNKSHQHI